MSRGVLRVYLPPPGLDRLFCSCRSAGSIRGGGKLIQRLESRTGCGQAPLPPPPRPPPPAHLSLRILEVSLFLCVSMSGASLFPLSLATPLAVHYSELARTASLLMS
jgi:hypothetical protein